MQIAVHDSVVFICLRDFVDSTHKLSKSCGSWCRLRQVKDRRYTQECILFFFSRTVMSFFFVLTLRVREHLRQAVRGTRIADTLAWQQTHGATIPSIPSSRFIVSTLSFFFVVLWNVLSRLVTVLFTKKADRSENWFALLMQCFQSVINASTSMSFLKVLRGGDHHWQDCIILHL